MNKIQWILLVLSTLTLSACFPSNNNGKTEVLLQGYTMGTTYNVKVVSSEAKVEA
jgi:thiamine biosynthesis lipoprotein